MSKYENLSKEQLLNIVEKQEKELKSKKYGLVWDAEREPEQVVLDCENNLPILKRVKGKGIRTNDDEDNIIIEGDNYHALTVLNYTHKGKIDVIYIDPPYNTGNKSWKYNNRYVEKEDGYRHSKWLNMMEKRLIVSKNLLSENGIIVITIDDFEKANLVLLADKIFGEINRLGIVSIMHNPRGRSDDKYLATSHEYALFYSKSILNVETYKLPLTEEQAENFQHYDDISYYRLLPLKRTGSNSTPDKRPNLYYPIYYDINTNTISVEKTSSKNVKELFPIDSHGGKRVWRWGKTSLMERAETEIVVKETNFTYSLFTKDRIKEGRKPKTIWVEPKYDASSHGTMLLKQILGIQRSFDYPKSIFSVLDTLKITSLQKKESTILDFFAGSGTTGHAVLELNKQDNGNRKFILCTNNENNICEDVTYPRVKNVITGYNKNGNGDFVEGLGGNLQYFKTSFVKKTKNRDQLKINLTRKCTEMLCVKENIFNEIVKEEDFKIFESNRKNKFLSVYFNFIDENFDVFLSELKKLDGKKIIYLFSLENKTDRTLFKEIDNFSIEPIPQKILDVYKQLVKMNIPEKKEVIFLELSRANKKLFRDNEKDEGARILRIVLQKTIQKIAQSNGINILNEKGKEERITKLNDSIKNKSVFTQLEWEENKTYLTIGNHAAHGEYDEYEVKHVKQFYKHVQSLLDNYNI